MPRRLVVPSYALLINLVISLFVGCGAIVPGAALHTDAQVDDTKAHVDDEDVTSSAATLRKESGKRLRIPSDLLGDAYYSPGQVVQASAEEPVQDDLMESVDSPGLSDAEAPQDLAVRGHVETISEEEFDTAVLAANMPVLVDFSATWCGPCKRLQPILEELAADRPDVKIVKVDIDESRALAATYRVRSVPTLLVFRQGEAIAQHRGTADRTKLEQLLDVN